MNNITLVIYLIVVVALSNQQTSYAQDSTQIIVIEQWTSLGNYDTSMVEYDLQSLRWIDSQHISVYIKTTPITPITKKVLQESNIGLHPVSAYNGYEYYAYNVREETIDLKHYQSTILNSWDYDILGGLLQWDRIAQQPQSVLASDPESVLINQVMGVITYLVVAKAE